MSWAQPEGSAGPASDAPATSDTPTEEPPTPPAFADLSDDVLERLCLALIDDFCTGVTSLVRLSRCCHRLHGLASDPTIISRCAEVYGIRSRSPGQRVRLALLGVAETVTGLGTNRIFFKKSNVFNAAMFSESCEPQMRPGSSVARLLEFVLLLRRHPALTLVIDGHEKTSEGMSLEGTDGIEMRHSHGNSLQRAKAVRSAMLEHECLERIDARGNKVWTARLPSPRFPDRIEVCGWEDSVAQIAGWTSGLETMHAECFFTMDGVTIPARPEHYARAAEERDANVGWQRYFAES